MVEGRNATAPGGWIAAQSPEGRAAVGWATLDLSGPYWTTFDTMLPDAVQIADPFRLVRLANQRLDEVRRRLQNQTLGRRGQRRPAVSGTPFF